MKYFKKLVGKSIFISYEYWRFRIYTKWLNDFNVTNGLEILILFICGRWKEWIKENSNKYQFAIVRLEDDKLIGNCSIHEIDQPRQCAQLDYLLETKKM